MKTTQMYDIDIKELRGSVRDRLTERAQIIAEGIKPFVAEANLSNLQEAYSDNPMAKDTGQVAPHYTREDVRKMLSTWQTPNVNANHFEDNFNNPVHRSKEGIDKLNNATTNDEDLASAESNKTKTDNSIKDPNYDHNTTIRLMKELYFTESDDGVITKYIDGQDADTSDDEEFKNALIKAQTLGEVIELQLDDGNTIDLNNEVIAKLIASPELFTRLMNSLESIQSVAGTLGLDIEDSPETSGEFYESEKDENAVFLETVLNYLDDKMPAAMATINESFFATANTPFSQVAEKLLESLPQENNRNFISRGRAAMVNRVRGGQLQLRKVISDTKGYKVVAGVAVRMKPAEIKKRKIAARFASKKRRNMQPSINRKTKISMRLHARRLGN